KMAFDHIRRYIHNPLNQEEAERQALLSVVESHERDKQALQAQIESHERDKQALLSVVESHERDKQALLSVVESHERDKQALQARIASHERDRQELISVIASQARHRQALQDKIESHESDRQILVDMVESKEKEINRLAAMLNEIYLSYGWEFLQKIWGLHALLIPHNSMREQIFSGMKKFSSRLRLAVRDGRLYGFKALLQQVRHACQDPDAIRYNLDSLESQTFESTARVPVSGWACAEAGIAAIDIYLNNTFLKQIT